MTIGELLFLVFCSIAVVNAIFIAVYIWFQRDKNIIPTVLFTLALILAAYRISILLLHDLLDDFQLDIKISVYLYIPTGALVGPLLYFYIKSVTQKTFKLKWIDLLHVVPFVGLYISTLYFYQSVHIDQQSDSYHLFRLVHISIILIQLLIYILLSFRYTYKLINISSNDLAVKETINPFWIKRIVEVVGILWIVLTIYLLEILLRTYLLAVFIEPLFYSIIVLMIILLELKYKRITTINNFTSRNKSISLPAQEIIKYKTNLLDYMREKEIYKEHNVTLVSLAKQLTITPHLLSQLINEQFNCNFNDFINSYRIEEAKKMLKDPERENYTIASIAYDCGFNTLSAFNVAFKKFTGKTPSQFRSEK